MRLTQDEQDKIKAIAKQEGFRNVSDYVRYYTVGEGKTIREDIRKILEKLEEK